MNVRKPVRAVRRRPKQFRSGQTVAAILDAVIRILKREGIGKVTTNRIAEVGGISIGSVYQYFPDKRAIFVALHERHIEQVDQMVEATLSAHATAPLARLMEAMIGAMIDAHAKDPELHSLLLTEVPHRADGSAEFAVRLHGAFLLAISSRAAELKKGRDLRHVAFIVASMVESLSHGVAFRRPSGFSLAEAKKEAARAVLAYLRD